MIWAAVTHLFSWCYGLLWSSVLGSIVVSIPACHTGDRGLIPHQVVIVLIFCMLKYIHAYIFFTSLRMCINVLKVDLNM